MTDGDLGRSGTSRRDLLKKAAVAGAVAWTAPVVMSRPAFAQGTLGTDKCECVKPNGSVTRSGGVTSITYRYVPRACNNPADSGRCVSAATGAVGALGCTGDSSGVPTVKVRAYRNTGNFSNACQTSATELPISVGGAPEATGGVLVNANQTFIIGSTLSPNATVILYNPATDAEIQRVCYHFSCSQPLCVNDIHGPLTVVDYEVSSPCS